MRKKAAADLSEIADAQVIDRLLSLLSETDTNYRRAAVQTLGMIGTSTVKPLLKHLEASTNPTERASCVKAIAAIPLYFPDERATFPEYALDGLNDVLNGVPDPVSKLATVGCLGMLGSDATGKEGQLLAGNSRAVDILLDLCSNSPDMALSTTAVGAISQIAQNASPELKTRIIDSLRKLCERGEDGDDESGFCYVREVAATHLEQLESGLRVPEQ